LSSLGLYGLHHRRSMADDLDNLCADSLFSVFSTFSMFQSFQTPGTLAMLDRSNKTRTHGLTILVGTMFAEPYQVEPAILPNRARLCLARRCRQCVRIRLATRPSPTWYRHVATPCTPSEWRRKAFFATRVRSRCRISL